MAASVDEADVMVAACEEHGVFFNVGTNRRWDPGYDRMKELIDSGRLGSLLTLTIHQTHALFSASHSFDLLQRLRRAGHLGSGASARRRCCPRGRHQCDKIPTATAFSRSTTGAEAAEVQSQRLTNAHP